MINMTDNQLNFQYGRILGKIESVLTYLDTASYPDKDVINNMLRAGDDACMATVAKEDDFF